METQTLDIPVVWPDYFEDCQNCIDRLQELLAGLDGMSSVSINPDRRTVQLSYDKELLTFEEIKEVARLLGVDVAEHYRHESLRVVGLDCPDCAAKLEAAVRRLHGVAWASLNYATSVLIVEFEPAVTRLASIENKIRDLGYDVEPEKPEVVVSPKARERRSIRLALTGVSGGLLAVAGVLWLMRAPSWTVSGVLVLSAVTGGLFTVRSALLSLRGIVLDTNVLVTIAAAGAIALREYFDAAAVMFLFSLGSTLEAYTVERARRSIASLIQAMPSTAAVYRDGRLESVSLEDIEIGEIVLIRPGEKIPVDGTVLTGESAVNEAPITGESTPRHKTVGDTVYAGSVNGHGSLEVRTTNRAQDNTIARIVHMVEEAQAQKAPSERLSAAFGRYYTPCVIALAVLVVLAGPTVLGGDARSWIGRALTLLVVSCPCALVISTPVAVIAAIANAAKSGVLIKGGAHLETLGAVTICAFDKTGTLTKGEMALCGVVPFNGHSADEVLKIAAAVESRSEHPLADAIVRAAREADLPELHVSFFEAFPGKGARAVVDGEAFYIGSPRLMEELSLEVPGTTAMAELQTRGCTVVYLADSSSLWGAIGVADMPKNGTAEAIRRLKRIGIRKTVMLTGDTAQSGRAIATMLGIDEERSELLPGEKLAAMKEIRSAGTKVAMVGDGINDAPALAAADVGIAMGGVGSQMAIEAADVALMADDIAMLPYAISLSRKTRRVIIENTAFALAAVIGLLIGALTQKVTLATGVLGHEASALLVIVNSMRLLKHD